MPLVVLKQVFKHADEDDDGQGEELSWHTIWVWYVLIELKKADEDEIYISQLIELFEQIFG